MINNTATTAELIAVLLSGGVSMAAMSAVNASAPPTNRTGNPAIRTALRALGSSSTAAQ